jgi:hypothetical protein
MATLEQRLKTLEAKITPARRYVTVFWDGTSETKETAIARAEATTEPALPGQETWYVLLVFYGWSDDDLREAPASRRSQGTRQR